jgi:hypothetical protein
MIHANVPGVPIVFQSRVDVFGGAKKYRIIRSDCSTCNVSGRGPALFPLRPRLPNPDHQLWCPGKSARIRQEAWSRYQLAFAGSASARTENKVRAIVISNDGAETTGDF